LPSSAPKLAGTARKASRLVPNSSLLISPIIRNIRWSGFGTSGSGTRARVTPGVVRKGTSV
jgi:hypothetical protein